MWTTIAEAWQNTESFGDYNANDFYTTNFSGEKPRETAQSQPEPEPEPEPEDIPSVSFKDKFEEHMEQKQYTTPFVSTSSFKEEQIVNRINKNKKKDKEKFSILNKKCDYLNKKIENLTENFSEMKKKQKSIETFNSNNPDNLFNKN